MLLNSSSQYRLLGVSLTKKGHLRTQSSTMSIHSVGNKGKKKKPKKKKTRSGSSDFDLTPLKGKTIKKAPKIYENQIFSDFYDEKGNHDRIVELSSGNPEYQAFPSIPNDLLQLPSAGRNCSNNKRIIFY